MEFISLEEYKEYLEGVSEKNPKVGEYSAKLLRNDKNIDLVMADGSLSEREFIEIIALCRQVNYNRAIGGANKAAENETDRLYAKNPWKFVEEFLQNADDCNYSRKPEIDIIVDARDKNHCSIEFSYNEEGFTRNDIWAITAFSESTKVNDTVKLQKEEGVFYKEKTGRKGKGFKSVFSLRAENIIVHIRSNGFSFKLDNKIGRIMPVWEEDPERMDDKTHVIVELIKPGFSVDVIYPEFRRLFCVDDYEGIFNHSPFLFMHRLRLIQVTRIKAGGTDSFITEYHEKKEKTIYSSPVTLSAGKELLGGIARDGIYYREQFQEGEITTLSDNERSFSIPLLRYTRMIEDDQAYRNYSITAPIITTDSKIKWQGGSLFRTFPMSQHPINMPFAIDAPFILNPDRSGVQYSAYKDEEGQQITANTWNTIVTHRLFEKNGVYEAFFLWLRSIKDIRIDRYMSPTKDELFGDKINSDDHGNTWIPKIDISDLCKGYPVFRLFAKTDSYVSYKNARLVSKDIFSWPYVSDLFVNMLGADYESCIVSDIYIGSSLLHARPIVENDFVEAMNTYLDRVEEGWSLEADRMSSFFNTKLYPYLKDNASLIKQKDPEAFKKLRIYLSRLKQGNTVRVVREARSDEIRWIHSDKTPAPLSINRFRIFESSPADLNILGTDVHGFPPETMFLNFGPKNQNIMAKGCKTWTEARDYIEAIYHYGYTAEEGLRFECLKKYVFSKNIEPGFNAFRETGVLKTINDEEIKSLVPYFNGSLHNTINILKRMGVRTGQDYLQVDGPYFVFPKDTIEVLESALCPDEVLQDIKSVTDSSKRKINTTYSIVKNFQEKVLVYFLDESKKMFSADSYTDICRGILKNEEYWQRNDSMATEILIRAVAGCSQELTNKKSRNISISLEKVLRRGLEACIVSVAKNNTINTLTVLNEGYFAEIPEEEIAPKLSLLKYDTGESNVRYYKGDLSRFGGKSIFIRDVKGGNVYLHCSTDGDYHEALEKCADKRFDMDTLKYYDEMERQYQDVKNQIIVPLLNETDHDLRRTYDEVERRFDEYSKKQIISILSWFRNQGYTNALGNGNINNEKEIEDDYREEPWKFVYEFIQNIDDCSFDDRNPELKLSVNSQDNQIVFEYNETGFTLEDIMALTKFGDSNKRGKADHYSVKTGLFDYEKTGRKGRGFKSVFALPGNNIIVHILSNGFSFKFVKRLGSIIPIWEDSGEIPSVGTKIVIEGFRKDYINRLMPQIKKMLGVDDIKSFFAVCPFLYLRKLGKVTVEDGREIFSVDLSVENMKFRRELFEGKGEIIAGILHNGQLKKDVWERFLVSVRNGNTIRTFQAVRYSRMFIMNEKTRTASVFAPIITTESKQLFDRGGFCRTLPLAGADLPLPLSINAPFATDSGRSKLEDRSEINANLIKYVLGKVVPAFFQYLRLIPEIRLDQYIPPRDVLLFEDYKNIETVNITDIILDCPILVSYDGSQYVSCSNAKVLPDECYKWPQPEILSASFDNSPKILVKQRYAKLHGIKHGISLNNDRFVDNMNEYLDALTLDGQSYCGLATEHIYPYLENNYENILKKYREENRQDELKAMRIFVFKMADESYVREDAAAGIWVKEMPNNRLSFGQYRIIASSSLAGIADQNWVKDIHETVPFNQAFTEKMLNTKSITTWDQAMGAIETTLYYDINRKIRIPYLSKCVLSKEFDQDENIFRDGYEKTGRRDIIDHLIDTDDLHKIEKAIETAGAISVPEIAAAIKEMGIRQSNDFFDLHERDLYEFNTSTLALLEAYCHDRENVEILCGMINQAADEIRNKRGGSIHITYSEIQTRDVMVLARILEYKLVNEESRKNLAKDFCKNNQSQGNADYDEAYIRAIHAIGKIPEKQSVSMGLNQIKERRLGYCMKSSKLSNPDNLELHIIPDESLVAFPNESIEKALHWLDDEDRACTSYKYYTADLKEAFGNAADTRTFFLFDDEKVLLQEDNAENCLLKFVQARYRGKDEDFSALINIISEQNELKRPWPGSKEDYIVKLGRFRELTQKQQKILFPDYDKHLNEATGNPLDYIIPELLQNINDCAKGEGQNERTLEVAIDINKGTMLLRYDEAGFDYSNVYSITALGQSTKHDESEGEKGLGFKKVFALFDTVEIYSNGFCFSLNAEKNTVPKWIGSRERRDEYLSEGKTSMLFTATGANIEKLQSIRTQWEKLIDGEYVGNRISPLFLKNIDFIYLDGKDNSYSRKEMEKDFLFIRRPLLTFYEELLENNDATDARSFMEHARTKLKTRKKCANMSPAEKERYVDSISIEICIPRNITKENDGKGCLYSTLPTETPLYSTIFINAPLELSTGRNEINEASDYNKMLFELLFASRGSCPSVFSRLIEIIADENREIFMLNYICSATEDFIQTICSLTGEDQDSVREAMELLDIFREYEGGDLVSLAYSYSVDRIIYQYLKEVQNYTYDIKTWMQEHTVRAKNLYMLSLSTTEECKKVESFASKVCIDEGYFPLKEEKRDVMIEYMSDELGREGSDDDNEQSI